MADLVLVSPGGERVVATCPGDTPVTESPEVWVTAEFILCPVHPFAVQWPDRVHADGCPDATGTILRIPALGRVWVLASYDAARNMFKFVWPD